LVGHENPRPMSLGKGGAFLFSLPDGDPSALPLNRLMSSSMRSRRSINQL